MGEREGVGAHLLSAVHDRELREGLTHLQAVVLPELPPEDDTRPRDAHAALQGVVDHGVVDRGIIAPVHARGRLSVHRTREALMGLLGDEGHERRQELGEGLQDLKEGEVSARLVRVLSSLPEAAPGATHVPVGQVVHELNEPGDDVVEPVALHLRVHITDEALEHAERPAIDLCAL